MKKVPFSEVKPYSPPCHFGMTALKIQGADETGVTKFWQGISHFLPNGGAEKQYSENTFGAEFEKTYIVVEGSLTVINSLTGEEHILNKYDSIALLANEEREVINNTNLMATAIVTVSTS